jgi:hypothetical protein
MDTTIKPGYCGFIGCPFKRIKAAGSKSVIFFNAIFENPR